MKTNRKRESIYTHQGAKAQRISPELQLRRSVMSCLLWEREFYEEGKTIARRISELVPLVEPEVVALIAIEARHDMKLRHVPLLVVEEMSKLAKHKRYVATTLAQVIQRPDEITEFMSLYWAEGKHPISKQVKLGLAMAFQSFDEYQFAKYDRAEAVKLRDIMFLVHPKPKDKVQELIFKKMAEGKLETPDTWEVALSTRKDGSKKESWERLLQSNKMGALALLRNMRNFVRDDVDEQLIATALDKMNTRWVLPFRFVVAAQHCPDHEGLIEKAMFKCCESGEKKLKGRSLIVIDVSGSMYGTSISKYSEMDRAGVACSLAVLLRELCEKPVIYATAGNDGAQTHSTKKVPARRGMSLRDAIFGMCRPLGGGGIFLKQVMDYVKEVESDPDFDRVIVVTDEQDCDNTNAPMSAQRLGRQNYIINVASAENGIGYKPWVHIDGWSEAVTRYILEYETCFPTQ